MKLNANSCDLMLDEQDDELCCHGIELKTKKKSLPGFLAKNVDLICKWLKDYSILFQAADDAQIQYFKSMSREKRNQLIDDYVKIHEFMKIVDQLKNNALNVDEQKCETTTLDDSRIIQK